MNWSPDFPSPTQHLGTHNTFPNTGLLLDVFAKTLVETRDLTPFQGDHTSTNSNDVIGVWWMFYRLGLLDTTVDGSEIRRENHLGCIKPCKYSAINSMFTVPKVEGHLGTTLALERRKASNVGQGTRCCRWRWSCWESSVSLGCRWCPFRCPLPTHSTSGPSGGSNFLQIWHQHRSSHACPIARIDANGMTNSTFVSA